MNIKDYYGQSLPKKPSYWNTEPNLCILNEEEVQNAGGIVNEITIDHWECDGIILGDAIINNKQIMKEIKALCNSLDVSIYSKENPNVKIS